VLYGSETGNAQDVAEEIARTTERLRCDTVVLPMDGVQLRDLVSHTLVVFAISTTGQGEMPQNARTLWKSLLSSALRPGVLHRLRFSSFGIGDSSYPQYNVAHRMLYSRLVQLGAQAFSARGEGNEQHPNGHTAGLLEWMKSLKQDLVERFPLPEGVPPIADDVLISPAWQLQQTGASGINAATTSSRAPGATALPSTELVPVRNALAATVHSNQRLTAAEHFQDARLLDLRIEDQIEYGPGAVTVVYPKNFPEDVAEFIRLMAWEQVADEALKLVQTKSSKPSPLAHLALEGRSLTLRWLLENVLDIMSIPRRSFFASLVHFADKDDGDAAYQRERLLELANPELIDELWDYTTRPKRTILEVMMDFTTIQIPWQHALSVIPLMRGRQFSIASGGALTQDERGRTRIQLLIAIVDPPSPIIKWRRRYGVCTRYIATLQEYQHINISVQPGFLAVRPEDLQYPAIMIGPGTGVAPMRSLIHQRLAWARASNSPQALSQDLLIFGCRNPSNDYFFRDEWDRLQHSDALTVLTAFSRDATRPKQYVQDQIRANGERICEALTVRAAKVFVCGASGNMPKGVRQALVEVLMVHGPTMGEEQAEAFFARMEKDGRYKQETW